MPRCPHDAQELQPTQAGLLCGRCGGAWRAAEELGQAASVLAPETRTGSAAFKQTRPCPECGAVLAPWRIGQLEAWADRCPGCERFWLEKQDLRSLELLTKRAARETAYKSFDPSERAAMARDLALASEGDGYPLSTFHKALAWCGLPVIRRTQGSRTPTATWLLALLLVVIFVALGPDAAAQWGYHPATPSVADALSANFIHFGLWHLVGNLYFLLAFGDGVEQRLWRPALLALFLFAGAASLALDGLVQPDVEVIAGASGGIAALMGACVVLQPQSQVVTDLAGFVVRVPIWGYGLLELAFQALMAALGLPGVAWVAHVAGLLLGGLAGAGLRATRLQLSPRPGA